MKRVALFSLVIAVLLPAGRVASQDNSGDFPTKISGRRYQIWSTADKAKAYDMLKHMELVFGTYTKLLGLARAPSRKMTIVMYKDYKEYLAAGSPGGSVAYYDGSKLVGYYNKEQMYNYFAHEGFHQFTDVGLKSIDSAKPWFTEGMAECIGNSITKKKKLYMCVKDGQIAWENITIIRAMVKANAHTDFESMLKMEYNVFMSKRGMYPQSWSMCHFLMSYPNYEDPKGNQIPNGKYWKVLSRFIQVMSRGKVKNDDAIKACFVDKRRRPLDLKKLEEEWKEYVLNWPIRGKDEEDEDIPETILKKIKEDEKNGKGRKKK